MLVLFKKHKILAAAVIIIAGAVVVFAATRGPKEPPYELTIVQRGTLVERVLATGTVKASEEVALSFLASGRVAAVFVRAGDRVEANQELARLDTVSLNAQVKQASAALDTARANLNKALAGTSAEDVAVAQRSVDSAQTALDNANANAEVAISKTYTDSLDVLQNIRLKADAALQALNNFYDISCSYQCMKKFGVFIVSDAAKQKAEIQKPFADSALVSVKTTVNGITTASSRENIDTAINNLQVYLEAIRLACSYTYDALQTDADKTIVKNAWTDLNTVITQLNAQEQIIASTKITNDGAIKTAQAQLAAATAQLEATKAPAREVDLAGLRAQVSQAAANLDTARANLDNSVLRAPTKSVVTAVNIKKGEVATASVSAISLIADTPFAIEADVPEADIAKIEVGDPLMITLDAISGAELNGIIISVDPASKILGGVVTYRIQASIESAELRVKSGMTANLDIETNRAENVLFVPQRAVIERDGGLYVRVPNGQDVGYVQVQVGIRAANSTIEIRGGVAQGDTIVNYMNE